MKQTTKVLAINISVEELKDVRRAYEKMIAGVNISQMITAMEALTPNRKVILTPALLHQELEMCYREVMDSWGKPNADGSLDVDLFDIPSAGCGSLGFFLSLHFNKDKEFWLWALNLEVASDYVYPMD